MKRCVLVTGAAGFIGCHTALRLARDGWEVVGLDNMNDYYDPQRKHDNLQWVSSNAPEGSFRFVQGDIRDRKLLEQLFVTHEFGVVVHLAAMAGVRASIANPYLYWDVNLTGTMNLLEAAVRYGLGNFVFASTSSVYGNTRRMPFVEDDPCDRPLAPYAASKRAGELLGHTYHHLHGLNFTALRFFTVYGPRGRPDMMAHKVLDNIFFGRAVKLYNSGQMHRDWTFIGDIVEGVAAAAGRPLGYEIINLGRGEPILLKDFISTLEQLTGHKARLTPAPAPAADVPYTYADISKAKDLLGYSPRTPLEEGLRQMWRWYRQEVLAPQGLEP